MEKICIKCKISKKLEEFWKCKKNIDGFNNKCKICSSNENKKSYFRTSGKRNKYIINRRRNQSIERNEYIKSLNIKCERCGFNNPAALDFHHKNPKEKKDTIGNLKWSGCSNEVFKNEIEKCIVLCANCHRIEHYK